VKKSLFLILILLPILAWAAGPFDGTWKIDPSKIQYSGQKPLVLLLQNGIFECPTGCVAGAIKAKADGTDQPMVGSKDIDTISVRIVGDKTADSTMKKGGKIIETIRNTISEDGKTSTLEVNTYPEASKQPTKYRATYTRVAAGPPSSHAISGTWQLQFLSYDPVTITIKSSPEGLTISDPMGQQSDAKFDGKDYPVKGATGNYTASWTKVNERSIDQTSKRDGKITSVSHWTVSDDGKTITIKSESKVSGTTTTTIAIKQ